MRLSGHTQLCSAMAVCGAICLLLTVGTGSGSLTTGQQPAPACAEASPLILSRGGVAPTGWSLASLPATETLALALAELRSPVTTPPLTRGMVAAVLILLGTSLALLLRRHLSRLKSITAALETQRNDLQQAEEALQKALGEWQGTFDAVSDVIWILDLEQRIVRYNRATSELFGEATEGILGRRCCEVVHCLNAPVTDCPFPRMVETLKRQSMEQQFGHRWFLISVDPFLDTAGSLKGAVHIVSDITERKVRELRDQLRSAVFEKIARGGPLPETLDVLCRTVETEIQEVVCAILLVDESGRGFCCSAAPNLAAPLVACLDGEPIAPEFCPCSTAVTTRSRAVANDLAAAPPGTLLATALEAGYRSCWAEPILSVTAVSLDT